MNSSRPRLATRLVSALLDQVVLAVAKASSSASPAAPRTVTTSPDPYLVVNSGEVGTLYRALVSFSMTSPFDNEREVATLLAHRVKDQMTSWPSTSQRELA